MPDTVKLKKFGDEVAIGLADALEPLLAKEVNVELSHVGNSAVSDIEAGLSYSCFCALLKDVEGGGFALLLVKERDASILADLLIGQDGGNAPDKMTELHVSAFGEVIHQIVEVINQGAKLTFGSRSGWIVEKTRSRKNIR